MHPKKWTRSPAYVGQAERDGTVSVVCGVHASDGIVLSNTSGVPRLRQYRIASELSVRKLQVGLAADCLRCPPRYWTTERREPGSAVAGGEVARRGTNEGYFLDFWGAGEGFGTGGRVVVVRRENGVQLAANAHDAFEGLATASLVWSPCQEPDTLASPRFRGSLSVSNRLPIRSLWKSEYPHCIASANSPHAKPHYPDFAQPSRQLPQSFIFPTAVTAQSKIWDEEKRGSLKKPKYKKKDLNDRCSKVSRDPEARPKCLLPETFDLVSRFRATFSLLQLDPSIMSIPKTPEHTLGGDSTSSTAPRTWTASTVLKTFALRVTEYEDMNIVDVYERRRKGIQIEGSPFTQTVWQHATVTMASNATAQEQTKVDKDRMISSVIRDTVQEQVRADNDLLVISPAIDGRLKNLEG
ncbi:hypothetical protein HD554DRAFT_2040402 [Boletus coccyginus]|nr:hypothetical protein HD554DRAFT_2040402 [Boletus coccyginus]